MADTRCANPAYQLDVDELTLEYLIYNTLKAHIDEWDPKYQSTSESTADEKTARKNQAPTLLALLDSAFPLSLIQFLVPRTTNSTSVTATVHLFKSNHPAHPRSENTAFYFKLLEFLLLFSHRRGGPSLLSEGSCLSARAIGKDNAQRRTSCWEAYEQLKGPLVGAELDLLINGTADQRVHVSAIDEDGAGRPVPLSALLPLFMEISAEVVALTHTDVSSTWMKLAGEFMLHAAIEQSPPGNSISKTAQACLGWGLPISVPDFALVTGVEDRDVADMERKIHAMLRSAEGEEEGEEEGSSQDPSWDVIRLNAIEEVVRHHNPDRPFSKTLVKDLDGFQSQVLHYIQNLQTLWAQLNGLPTLLQIEQGQLDGLDDEEFKAFMERVGSEEHDAWVSQIELPVMPKA
jgi:hypothetical protein